MNAVVTINGQEYELTAERATDGGVTLGPLPVSGKVERIVIVDGPERYDVPFEPVVFHDQSGHGNHVRVATLDQLGTEQGPTYNYGVDAPSDAGMVIGTDDLPP